MSMSSGRVSRRVHTLLQRVELGSADGGSFADTTYMPMLFALMLFGLFIALLGFWRVGASYATQQSAIVGAVSPNTGGAFLEDRWTGWSNGNFPSGGFAVNSGDRSAQADLSTHKTFDFYGLNTLEMPIRAQTHTRSERFYPGGPVCDGDGCDE
jgi:hypothetical protein